MLSLAALADPTRRRIVELLAEEEYTAGEIVEEFDLSASAISQHLKLLRESGLLTVKVDGQRRVYFLNPAGFTELDEWLHRTKSRWSRQKEPPSATVLPPSKASPRSRSAPKPPAPAEADTGWEIIKMENP